MDDDGVEKGRGIEGTMAQNDDCLIDVEEGEDGDGRSRKLENSKVCRICHFGKELELITLGCDCKGELGSSHQHCAEAWFGQKGDRYRSFVCFYTRSWSRISSEESDIWLVLV